jgi:TatD DNase family protein
MIDIHTHLQFPDFDADRDAVIARAREAGVEKMILVGTDVQTSRAAIALAERHDFLFVSVGIHPHSFNEIEGEITNTKLQVPNKFQITNSEIQNPGSRVKPGMTEGRESEREWIAEVRELAKHPKVVAIGECGLDYFSREKQSTVNEQQKSAQMNGFLAQMGIAREAGLPLVVHTRPSAGTMDAYEDMFDILRGESQKAKSYKLNAILHCYQGDTEITRKFLGLPDVYFSFAGSVTYPVKKSVAGTKDDPAEVVKLVPAERIFVETDCPYLAPQPVRGTRNEPSYVAMTAERVAEMKGVTQEELESAVSRGFSRVFGGSKMEE